MLIGAIVAGLVLGLLAGGSLDNLARARLRLVQVLFLGFALRYATEFAIDAGNEPADALRLPLFAAGFALLLFGLWQNREQPGIPLAFVGILLNAVAMVANAGFMPVWAPAISAAGLSIGDATQSAFHILVNPTAGGAISPEFLLRLIPLGDIVPIPVPGLRNVASVGDFLLAGGFAFFLFATTVRAPAELDEAAAAVIRRRLSSLDGWAEGLEPYEPELLGAPIGEAAAAGATEGLVAAAALERPLGLGGSGVRGEGTLARGGTGTGVGVGGPAVPAIITRVRRHPYVRLALDSSFSALWTGQLISLVGDRVHQVALAFLVLRATNSPLDVGLVFLVATAPNLLFGPIAGTLVDRWDHREVMIVSDLTRAGIVLLIPIAAVTNLALVYPLVFLVTTISIFFRPAKGAILPRIVSAEDLIPANSALWVSENFADIGGYVLAGLFVALLGSQLPLAFWVDSVTYVASALLVASIAVAPLARMGAHPERRITRGGAEDVAVEGAADGELVDASHALGSAAAEDQSTAAKPGFFGELRDGWRFLRADTVLLANTLQAAVGQFMLGIFLALTPVFADQSIDKAGFDGTAAYSFIEGAIGAGNLIGGFVIGLLGARLALGRLVILGYVVTGLFVAGLAASGNLYLAVGMAFGAGVGNLAFVIPSQTLVQRRTPQELMGRVLGLRYSLVFGSMTIAMGVGGALGQIFGVSIVIGLFGIVTVVAGLAGLLVPAVREARSRTLPTAAAPTGPSSHGDGLGRMTDERTDHPIDETPDAALEPEEPTAGDLLAAEDELPEDELPEDEVPGGELAEDEATEDDELPEDEAVLAEPEPALGSRAGRAERAARDRTGRGSARPAPGTSVRGIALDPSLRIRDRASQAFVILAVLVYLAIFLNAMAFGHGGAFTTTPQPTVAASSSASPGASGASPAVSPAVSPAAS